MHAKIGWLDTFNACPLKIFAIKVDQKIMYDHLNYMSKKQHMLILTAFWHFFSMLQKLPDGTPSTICSTGIKLLTWIGYKRNCWRSKRIKSAHIFRVQHGVAYISHSSIRANSNNNCSCPSRNYNCSLENSWKVYIESKSPT